MPTKTTSSARKPSTISSECSKRLIERAQTREGFKLAPFIGIGCPGMIEPDGSIDRGAQNLPGNWEMQPLQPADADP